MTAMIAFALLAQAPVEAAAPRENDIVVSARSPYDWVGNVSTQDGRQECKTEVSLGDGEQDAIMCRALLICGPQFQPQIDALVRPGIATGTIRNEADVRRAMRPVVAPYNKCMAEHFKPALRALAKQRRLH